MRDHAGPRPGEARPMTWRLAYFTLRPEMVRPRQPIRRGRKQNRDAAFLSAEGVWWQGPSAAATRARAPAAQSCGAEGVKHRQARLGAIAAAVFVAACSKPIDREKLVQTAANARYEAGVAIAGCYLKHPATGANTLQPSASSRTSSSGNRRSSMPLRSSASPPSWPFRARDARRLRGSFRRPACGSRTP